MVVHAKQLPLKTTDEVALYNQIGQAVNRQSSRYQHPLHHFQGWSLYTKRKPAKHVYAENETFEKFTKKINLKEHSYIIQDVRFLLG